MKNGHSQADGAQTPLGPGSEAIAPRFANQSKTDGSLNALGDESPAEHIRNALQILAGAERLDRHGSYVALERDDVAAIVRRLVWALERIEPARDYPRPLGAPRLEPILNKGLELRTPGVPLRRCIYCRCTDLCACQVPVAQLAADDRAAVSLYYRDNGWPLAERVPCWWISEDPPVCSNPHCAELHRGRVTP